MVRFYLMKRAFCAGLLLIALTSIAFAADTYKDEVLRISGLVQNKQYQQAIDAYKKIIQDPSLAQWQRSASYADLTYLYFNLKQTDAGLGAFEKAVQLGFDDFLSIHQQPAFKSYFSNDRFKTAYSKMRMSMADMTELVWLSAEAQSAVHDMTMMIQENTGRKDALFTEIPQQQIPTRKTSSVGVLTNRMVLEMIQQMQRENVRQSDLSRINHLMQMKISNQMPGSVQNPAASEKEVQESSRKADDMALQRKQAVEKRRFVLPAGASNAPVPVPPLGSLKMQ